MRPIVRLALILLLSSLFMVPAEAQFGGFNLPKDLPLPKGIPNPFGGGGKTPSEMVQQQAKSYLSGMVTRELDADPPLLLDQHSAPPPAAPPDGFKPTKLTTVRDLNRPLPPGDYAVDVMFYCTKYSIHRGGHGVPYKLARAQGRLVRPMCALLNRGSLQHIAPATLNAEAWRMQDGLPLSQWPPADQALAHRLIPEYEDTLQGDFVQKMKHDYDTKFGFLLHKSFDEVLGMLGDPGEEVLKLEKGRQLLADRSISNDRLPDMLYQQAGEGGDPVLAGNGSGSPWSEIQPGVLGRFTNVGGYLQRNLLEMRVTPDAAQPAGTQAGGDAPQGPTLSHIMGLDEAQGGAGQSNLIAYPIDQPSQDPLLTPILGDASGGVTVGKPGDGTGEPIDIATGNVYDETTDYHSAGPAALDFTRYYNSMGDDDTAGQLGPKWRSTYDACLQIVTDQAVTVVRPDGHAWAFTQRAGVWKGDGDERVTLTHSGTSWTLTDSDDSAETYNPPPSAIAGTLKIVAHIAVLTSVRARGGYTQTLRYGPVRGAGPFAELLSVTDSYGRSLRFAYQGALLSRVTTPDGLVIGYAYDSSGVTPGGTDRLRSVSYSTSPPSSLSYAYENPSFPLAMTGMTDENGHRFASWTYDQKGRALSSELGQSAFATALAYNDGDGSRTVTNALGQQEIHRFKTLQNKPKLIEIDRSATATTAAAVEKFTYDGSGFTASETDWNGRLTTYLNDASGQPTRIVEAAGTRQARTTTITYRAGFHLPTEIVTPGLTTTLTYDADGDLLTKTLTDTASSATSPGGAQRTWTYAWAGGLLASVRGPRADVAEVTRFTYDAAGVLRSTTNALGQVTQVTQHTPGGLPLAVVDAAGVTTKVAYDARQRLVSSAVITPGGPLTTAYTYDPAGSLLAVTPPDGAALKSTYDDAHRLVGISDGLGQTIAYTLDGLGDRTQTAIAERAGTVQRQTAQSFDALGRLSQITGGAGQATGYAYDSAGNALTLTDPNNGATGRRYDALGRLVRITDPAHGVTATAYDAHDRPVSVNTPNGAVTTYTYDGFGDLTEQDSPDTGKTTYRYDADGDLTQRTDATGAVADYAYDALGRLKSVTYPAKPAEDVTYTYDLPGHGFGVGRLCKVADAAGTLSRTYDERGHVLSETRLHGSATLTTSYRYDAAGRLAQITYPSGLAVRYARDAAGQASGVAVRKSAAAAWLPVVSDVRYKPFGPVSALTFGNGVAETREYDADYRETGLLESGHAVPLNLSYGYDPADNVVSISDAVQSADSQSFGYDALNRLRTAVGGYGSLAYTYDPSGNRLTDATGPSTGASLYAPNSNRLTRFDVGGVPHTVTYTATGSMESITPALGTGAAQVSSFAYDQAGRLTSVAGPSGPLARYVYDAFGHRLVKARAGAAPAVTLYQYGLGGALLEEGPAAGPKTDYVYLNGTPVATVTAAGITYLHCDRLGTPQLATDSAQAAVWSAAYQPFGQTATATGAKTQNLRFPGQYADAETGLSQNGFRDYVPGLGRYLESDPIGLGGGLNTYAYVGASPLGFIDSTGLSLSLLPETPNDSTSLPMNQLKVSLPELVPTTLFPPRANADTSSVHACPETGQHDTAPYEVAGISDDFEDLGGGVPSFERTPKGASQWLFPNGTKLRFDLYPGQYLSRQGPHINIETGGQNIHVPILP